MWPFRRKKKRESAGQDAERTESEFTAELTYALRPFKQPPLPLEEILGICRNSAATAAEYDKVILAPWVQAASESGSLILLSLLCSGARGVPAPLARPGDVCTGVGFRRALSVVAAEFARQYGEAMADDDFDPFLFAARTAGIIDPFGAYYAEWIGSKFEEVKREGGMWEGLQSYYILLALHVAAWAPHVSRMPSDVQEAHASLPAPPSEAVVNMGSMTEAYTLIALGGAEVFLPRLGRTQRQ